MSLDYDKKEDIELICSWRDGDEYAFAVLFSRYKQMVRAVSRHYFLIGADHEDLIQEGMIGFYKAIQGFDENRQAEFHSFARMCVERHMMTAVKTAARNKHKPLNDYISTSTEHSSEESGKIDLYSSLNAGIEDVTDPEEIILNREKAAIIEREIESKLSSFEKNVFDLFMNGMTYQEMSFAVGKPEKSIDNAIQRIKRKLKAIKQ
ncbi:MAG: sigma-70 family RNA polymerase sigma factor, partial [Clostridia bacterium]|nr:sigma-70 family RNA polymerase sigma factor [Clostridia bacterium]